jgi:RNA polymerase sigma factor (TIGR02999 family)
MEPSSGDVTQWLVRWSEGEEDALARLMPLVYNELRRLAAVRLGRERGDHTLETSALVHEAYLRLVDQKRVQWQDRAHFFSIAARIMRRVLVDHARRRGYAKRGGGAPHAGLDALDNVAASSPSDWLALDEALTRLAALDLEQSRIVELHFFGGLTYEEIAAVMGLSVPTLVRRWRLARAWLYRELSVGAAT